MRKILELQDICENLDYKRVPIKKNKRKSGEIPYYGASGIIDYVNDYIFDESLLLVSEDGANLLTRSYPIAYSISGKSWVNNHAHVLRFKYEATRRFVEYFLNSISLVKFVSGMVQPKLNQTMLNSIPIPLPALAEQQRIVDKIDAVFREIDKAILFNQKSLVSSKRLYLNEINEVFMRLAAKNEELGLHSNINYGYTTKTIFEKRKYKLLRITDLQENSVRWDKVAYCDVEQEKLEKILLYDGDLVVARTGATTGKSFLVEISETNCVFASYLIRVSLHREVLDPRYVRHFFQSRIYWQQVNKGISGSAQGGFNASKLSKLQIPIISKADQQEIILKLDRLYHQTKRLKGIYKEKLNHYLSLKSALISTEIQN